MRWIKYFEKFSDKTLIIVDVQLSFKKFFKNNPNQWTSDEYLKNLQNYCKEFNSVYQIWDNHVNGKNVDKEYLYKDNPAQNEKDDIYEFENQIDVIEKRYNYDVDVSFYKKILSPKTFRNIQDLESKNSLKKGDLFETLEGTYIVYVANIHRWFHCPKKLYKLLISLSEKDVVLVGGASNECLEDIVTLGKSISINIKVDKDFVYSAS